MIIILKNIIFIGVKNVQATWATVCYFKWGGQEN